jgi:ribose transport system permease protein
MNVRTLWARHSAVVLVYTVAILLFVFVAVMRPGYASTANLKVLSAQAAILGLATLGQTVVLLTGGMDLSIPWVFTNSAFLMALMSGGDDRKLVWAIPAVLALGVAMGLFNGIGVAYIGIAPVIMTIGSNVIFQGLLVGFSGGTPGGSAPPLLGKISGSSQLRVWETTSFSARR